MFVCLFIAEAVWVIPVVLRSGHIKLLLTTTHLSVIMGVVCVIWAAEVTVRSEEQLLFKYSALHET